MPVHVSLTDIQVVNMFLVAIPLISITGSNMLGYLSLFANVNGSMSWKSGEESCSVSYVHEGLSKIYTIIRKRWDMEIQILGMLTWIIMGFFFVIKPSDTKYLIIENLSIHMTNMFCDIKLSSWKWFFSWVPADTFWHVIRNTEIIWLNLSLNNLWFLDFFKCSTWSFPCVFLDGSHWACGEGVLASCQHHWGRCHCGIRSRHRLQGVWEWFPCEEQPFWSLSWGWGTSVGCYGDD